MSRYAKFFTAFFAAAGVLAVNLLTPTDAETANNIITAVIGLLGAIGVYAVPNAPAVRTESRHDYH